MAFRSCHVKYVFSDVEQFTREDRTREAQVEIIGALNHAFVLATEKIERKIFLPTGDGICLGINDPDASFDLHLGVALDVLRFMSKWSDGQALANRKCKVRIGLNEAVDHIVTDINDKDNLIGSGINHAQRVMSLADGNQIVASQHSYDSLVTSDKYCDKFFAFTAPAKQRPVRAYQFRDDQFAHAFLDISEPSAVRLTDPINLQLNINLAGLDSEDYMSKCKAFAEAKQGWEVKIRDCLRVLRHRSDLHSKEDFDKCQKLWEAYAKAQELYFGHFDSILDWSPIDVELRSNQMREVRYRMSVLQSVTTLHDTLEILS